MDFAPNYPGSSFSKSNYTTSSGATSLSAPGLDSRLHGAFIQEGAPTTSPPPPPLII